MKEQETHHILALLAHPDDEILGPGGTFALYAAHGTRIDLVCATDGAAGEIADPTLATPDTLAAVRAAELRCAADTLGIQDVILLNYRDSGMAGTPANEHPAAFINAPAAEVVARLVKIIREKRPSILVTFEPFGGYGHPDHIAIHHHTHAAFAAAADPAYRPDLGAPHQADRLFYPIVRRALFEGMQARMAARGMDTSFFADMATRRADAWPDDQVHVTVDVSTALEAKYQAFLCHRTQFGPDNLFRRLPKEDMLPLLQHEYFALAYPTPAAGLHLASLFAPLPDEISSAPSPPTPLPPAAPAPAPDQS